MSVPEPTPLPQLRAARSRLATDGAVASDLLPAPLARSWQRCLQAGLVPHSRSDDAVDHGERLRAAFDGNREMLAHARPVLDFVHDQIRTTGSLVVLADATGMLLHARGDEAFVLRAARVALRPGACWGEGARGTNAIGTALAERSAVVVHGGEHFLDANTFLTCAAAPIFASTGQALGVVDISGDHRGRHPHTLALVRSAARMIEDRLFAAHHSHHVRLHLHAQQEGIGSVGEGLLAIGDDGWLCGANATARAWLRLGGGELGGELGQRTLTALLGPEADRGLAHPGPAVRVRTRTGGALWLCAELPRSARVTASVATPAAAANGDDPQVASARQRAQRAIAAGLVLLLHGESGTGKDVFARELHRDSKYGRGPFVAVNCASIPEQLIEAELFGYVGGAFSGARRDGAPGHFREASGGTLFLDEIGDMPLMLQTRLLRVLEERRVQPLGGSRAIAVDVQLIAATHQDLRAAVATGRFRADLFYRLNGLAVTLPPLRERRDFAALCAALLHEARPHAPPRLAPAVAAAMRAFAWPGNLRQLRSALVAAAAMLDADEVEIDWAHLPDDVRSELHPTPGRLPADAAVLLPTSQPPTTNLRELSDQAIAQAIAASGRNMSEAARRLGISRNTLYRRLRQIPRGPVDGS